MIAKLKLTEAARAAREESVKVGVIERRVEIVVTDLGFEVRASVRIGNAYRHHTRCISFEDVETNRWALLRAVRAVGLGLRDIENAEAERDREDAR